MSANQRSNLKSIQNQLEMAVNFIGAILKILWLHLEMRAAWLQHRPAAPPGAGAKLGNLWNLVLHRFTTFQTQTRAPLKSEHSHFFKWLFVKTGSMHGKRLIESENANVSTAETVISYPRNLPNSESVISKVGGEYIWPICKIYILHYLHIDFGVYILFCIFILGFTYICKIICTNMQNNM